MSRKAFAAGLSDFFGIFSSAVAVSAATREHRRPRDADLQRLGIDPVQFRNFNHF